MSRTPITLRQREVLAFCGHFYRENDQLPPMRAIALHFGWASDNAAEEHLQALARKGFVEHNTLGRYRFTAKGRANITAELVQAQQPDERYSTPDGR